MSNVKWLGIRECAPPQGHRFDSPRCQFGWANLAYSKKIPYLMFPMSIPKQKITKLASKFTAFEMKGCVE